MSQKDSKRNNSISIAIIGLIGTIVTAVFGSPVLVEWIKSRQITTTPPAISTPIHSEEIKPTIVVTPISSLNEQVLIFQEDFDNDNVSGFAYQGNWQIGKDKNNHILKATGAGKATFGPSDFTNGVIEFRVQIQENIGVGAATVNFRESGENAYVLAVIGNQLVLGLREGDSPLQAFSAENTRSLFFESDAWYQIRVEVRGPEIVIFVDNNRIMSARDDRLSKGGLSFSVENSMQAAFDDVKVWELK